jgi:tetratricopeptide (TPR) repeat protein
MAKMKNRLNFLKYFLLLWLFIALFVGCAAPGPAIRIAVADRQLSSALSPDRGVEVGPFVSGDPRYVSLAEYCRHYLDQQLAKRLPAKRSSNPSPARLLRGDVAVVMKARPGDPAKTAAEVSIALNLADKDNDTVLQSTRLSQIASGNDGAAMRAVARRMIDDYVARLAAVANPPMFRLEVGASVHDLAGRKLAELGNDPAALAEFQKAIDDRPRDHRSLYNAGVMSLAMGRYPQAIQYFRRAAALSNRSLYRLAVRKVEAMMEY